MTASRTAHLLVALCARPEEDALITATDARRELMRLTAERLDAVDTGHSLESGYLTELDCEIDECRAAYELLAITGIATLRAELFGPQIG